jgi:hypothetical protein
MGEQFLPVVHQESEMEDPLYEEDPVQRIRIDDDGLNNIAMARTSESAEAWLVTDDWYPLDMMH